MRCQKENATIVCQDCNQTQLCFECDRTIHSMGAYAVHRTQNLVFAESPVETELKTCSLHGTAWPLKFYKEIAVGDPQTSLASVIYGCELCSKQDALFSQIDNDNLLDSQALKQVLMHEKSTNEAKLRARKSQLVAVTDQLGLVHQQNLACLDQSFEAVIQILQARQKQLIYECN